MLTHPSALFIAQRTHCDVLEEQGAGGGGMPHRAIPIYPPRPPPRSPQPMPGPFSSYLKRVKTFGVSGPLFGGRRRGQEEMLP